MKVFFSLLIAISLGILSVDFWTYMFTDDTLLITWTETKGVMFGFWLIFSVLGFGHYNETS